MSSPKGGSLTALTKLSGLYRARPVRMLVLGQSGVGKSALVVRYLTRRFIGEYSAHQEHLYQHTADFASSQVTLEILDSAGDEKDGDRHEANIRWADVFLLVYSVTDRCSFDDCSRAKFLINYNKRRRKITGNATKDPREEAPVLLVANKKDLPGDRMVTTDEGIRRSRDIGCRAFHEISARESIDEVQEVFTNAIRLVRQEHKTPRLRRAASEVHDPLSDVGRVTTHVSHLDGLDNLLDSLTNFRFCKSSHGDDRGSGGRTKLSPEEGEVLPATPFRTRACTDGLLHKGKFQKRTMERSQRGAGYRERNLSIAMKGESCSSFQ
ncbi:ras-related and estrogen-regulated growth inhibitor [Hyalella azteca]|uniref:small monomeric GTPase n=1 Tax=Hyalella azteca TaxID=294128 RepID=A0A8B7PI81_HYAAZ|nr:ras-related and estrogen-regulated growth inhibitor [Hyalella azteca]